jgi:hypothetical protein
MKNLQILTVLIGLGLIACPKLFAQNKYPFQNPQLTVEERIDNIISLILFGYQSRSSEAWN